MASEAEVQRRIAAVHQWWLHQHLEYPETATLHRLWKALEPFLGDLVYAGVNPQDHLPMFDARGTQVSFNELSSGERRIILLFLEIAMQCGEDGLVLFDEPEAHFHPKWQQMLPAALAELLPRGQVIVATHATSGRAGASGRPGCSRCLPRTRPGCACSMEAGRT